MQQHGIASQPSRSERTSMTTFNRQFTGKHVAYLLCAFVVALRPNIALQFGYYIESTNWLFIYAVLNTGLYTDGMQC
jgi:hypothetical protein